MASGTGPGGRIECPGEARRGGEDVGMDDPWSVTPNRKGATTVATPVPPAGSPGPRPHGRRVRPRPARHSPPMPADAATAGNPSSPVSDPPSAG
jgi:hypothetical protein